MYAVYIDGEILYSPLLADEGYALLSTKIVNELNKAGYFEFVLPPNNVRYNDIQKLKSIISVVSYDEPAYTIKNGEKISKSTQTSVPSRVLYKTATADAAGKITLSIPLSESGSASLSQYENYNEYPYFYGDLADGSQDSNVYKFTSITRSVSTGSITIVFYGWTYYKQYTEKTGQSAEIFSGRALYTEKDFYKKMHVYTEGELAFLLDSVQRPYSFQGDIPDLYKYYLNNHNSQVDSWKQFRTGSVTVTDSNNYINRESSAYPNTFDEISDKLIGTHGGYLRVRKQNGVRYLDYTAEPGRMNPQTIEFGKNLLDITEYITAENVYTVLIPLGAKDEETGTRLTIESVNDGKDYIESETGISLFGRIIKTYEWDDVTMAANLLTKGTTRLNSAIEMAVSLTMKAVDMHLLGVDSASILVGDRIRVVSPPHGIDTYFVCSKIELDILQPENSVYTFGVAFTALTEKVAAGNKAVIRT